MLDDLRSGSPADVKALVESATSDPWRRELLADALEFHGLAEAAGSLWAPATAPNEIVREVLAFRAMTPIDVDSPGWLQQCLRRVDDLGLEPEHRVRLEEVLAILKRLDRESPPMERFTLLTGIQASEVDEALPRQRDRDSRVREPALARAPAEQAANRGPRAGRSRASLLLRLGVPLAALLLLSIPVLSAATTHNSVTWTRHDSRMDESYAGPVVRGDGEEEPRDLDGTALEAARAVGQGWALLREAEQSTFGLFPRFEASMVARAALEFEEAGRYAAAPASIRGEALYGLAVAAWLQGGKNRAQAVLSDSAIAYSSAADRAARLRELLR